MPLNVRMAVFDESHLGKGCARPLAEEEAWHRVAHSFGVKELLVIDEGRELPSSRALTMPVKKYNSLRQLMVENLQDLRIFVERKFLIPDYVPRTSLCQYHPPRVAVIYVFAPSWGFTDYTTADKIIFVPEAGSERRGLTGSQQAAIVLERHWEMMH